MASENRLEEQLRRAIGEPDIGSVWELVALIRRLEREEHENKREISALKEDLENMRQAQADRERRTLVAGLMLLGSFVLGLLGVIWTLVSARVFGNG